MIDTFWGTYLDKNVVEKERYALVIASSHQTVEARYFDQGLFLSEKLNGTALLTHLDLAPDTATLKPAFLENIS